MKRAILIITLLFVGFTTQAQKKNAKHIIEVDGICMMCKKRIEKACLNTKGVKFAKWDIPSKQLTVIIDERRTSSSKVAEKVASIGHDTKEFKAPQEAYDNLHGCCKYRDDEIVKDHNGGLKKQKKQ